MANPDAVLSGQSFSPKVPSVAGRFYNNCRFGNTATTATVAALQRRTTFFEPMTDLKIDQIGMFATVAPTAGKIKLAVYQFNAANPAQLDLVHDFAEITADATIGAKMVSTNFTFRQGRTYVFVHHSDVALTLRALATTGSPSNGLAAIDSTANSVFWFASSVTYSATSPLTIDTATMTHGSSAAAAIIMRAA